MDLWARWLELAFACLLMFEAAGLAYINEQVARRSVRFRKIDGWAYIIGLILVFSITLYGYGQLLLNR